MKSKNKEVECPACGDTDLLDASFRKQVVPEGKRAVVCDKCQSYFNVPEDTPNVREYPPS